MVGFATTVNSAVLLAGPVPLPQLMVEVVFEKLPAPLVVTGTVIVQLASAPMLPLTSWKPVSPGALFALPAMFLSVPPQPLAGAGVAATVIPAGKVSLKLTTLVNAVLSPLVSVKVIVDFSPTPMLAGPNALATAICPEPSVAVLETGPAAIPVSLAVTPDAVLLKLPVFAVTSTITVQVELAAMEMPENVTLVASAPAPCALGMAPVHVPRPTPM